MRTLTTEEALQILIDWLQDNIDCNSGIRGCWQHDSSSLQLPGSKSLMFSAKYNWGPNWGLRRFSNR